MSSRIQIRRGTAANWASVNPVLADGEFGYDTTNRLTKVGNGVTAWNSLPEYVATQGTDLWIPATQFTVDTATPAITMVSAGINGWPAYAFDAATLEAISVTFLPPTAWATYKASLYWTNMAGGAGNVVWRIDASTRSNAQDLSSGAITGTQLAVSAPVSPVLKISEIQTGIAVNRANINKVRVVRVATDGGDTLANDAGVIGVLLQKVT